LQHRAIKGTGISRHKPHHFSAKACVTVSRINVETVHVEVLGGSPSEKIPGAGGVACQRIAGLDYKATQTGIPPVRSPRDRRETQQVFDIAELRRPNQCFGRHRLMLPCLTKRGSPLCGRKSSAEKKKTV